MTDDYLTECDRQGIQPLHQLVMGIVEHGWAFRYATTIMCWA
jgi:hypothetical protein